MIYPKPKREYNFIVRWVIDKFFDGYSGHYCFFLDDIIDVMPYVISIASIIISLITLLFLA